MWFATVVAALRRQRQECPGVAGSQPSHHGKLQVNGKSSKNQCGQSLGIDLTHYRHVHVCSHVYLNIYTWIFASSCIPHTYISEYSYPHSHKWVCMYTHNCFQLFDLQSSLVLLTMREHNLYFEVFLWRNVKISLDWIPFAAESFS